jgi:hypothetical protein
LLNRYRTVDRVRLFLLDISVGDPSAEIAAFDRDHDAVPIDFVDTADEHDLPITRNGGDAGCGHRRRDAEVPTGIEQRCIGARAIPIQRTAAHRRGDALDDGARRIAAKRYGRRAVGASSESPHCAASTQSTPPRFVKSR